MKILTFIAFVSSLIAIYNNIRDSIKNRKGRKKKK